MKKVLMLAAILLGTTAMVSAQETNAKVSQETKMKADKTIREEQKVKGEAEKKAEADQKAKIKAEKKATSKSKPKTSK
jgi:hypothetical protein